MSGAHTIHVRIDAASPKWSSGYYRFEQHYQFTLPSEQDTQYALARLAELCDELRNPPRDKAPEPESTITDQMLADMPPVTDWLAYVRAALDATEAELGGPPLGDETFDQRLNRTVLLLQNLRVRPR